MWMWLNIVKTSHELEIFCRTLTRRRLTSWSIFSLQWMTAVSTAASCHWCDWTNIGGIFQSYIAVWSAPPSHDPQWCLTTHPPIRPDHLWTTGSSADPKHGDLNAETAARDNLVQCLTANERGIEREDTDARKLTRQVPAMEGIVITGQWATDLWMYFARMYLWAIRAPVSPTFIKYCRCCACLNVVKASFHVELRNNLAASFSTVKLRGNMCNRF